jgi:two-component system OmpR family sensor kinase
VSLRTRLVLTAVGLLVVGLVLSVGATFGALQDWRARQSDDLLAVAADQVDAVLTTGATTDLDAAVGAVSPVWQVLAEHGDVPAFFQLRDADGRTRETVVFGPGPVLAEPLPADLLADVELGPAAARVVRVPGTAPAGGGPSEHWRVRVAPTAGGLLLVGQRATVSDELFDRTAGVAIGTSAAVLTALAVLSAVLVRRGLRPLDAIAATATAIGAGDLTQRIDDTSERTEVGRLGRALNAMLARLEEAFRARAASEERLRRFVADASHELRTPVATVRGYAELFRRGAARRPADLADAMHRIEAEATRMGELIDELLLLARLDQGRPLESEPVDLAEVAREAVHAARAIEPHRPLELTVDGDAVVLGDAPRLRQVVANLLANVRTHTPAGAPASVWVTGAGERVVLEVADSGPGLADHDRERVFERFYQGTGTSGGHGDGLRGSGLGLAIVAAVAAAHGGTAAAPPSNTGARFVVDLPRAGLTPAAAAPSG